MQWTCAKIIRTRYKNKIILNVKSRNYKGSIKKLKNNIKWLILIIMMPWLMHADAEQHYCDECKPLLVSWLLVHPWAIPRINMLYLVFKMSETNCKLIRALIISTPLNILYQIHKYPMYTQTTKYKRSGNLNSRWLSQSCIKSSNESAHREQRNQCFQHLLWHSR